MIHWENMKRKRQNKEDLYETVIKNGYSVRSGSYAVADNSVVMELDEFGQYAPRFEDAADKVIASKTLAKVCAMSDESTDEDEVSKDLFALVPGIKYAPILGYYLGLYAGHVTEGDYRQNASSGGFTTWILKELLEKKHIDGVIHVKESSKDKDTLFEYGISKTINEIIAGAKTRYYPAEFSEVLNAVKKTPGRYAIVGIPSFIMEIRLLARQDPDVRKSIAYTLGLVCGHQKSTKYAESLAWQCGIKPGNLISIDFRKKIQGAPANKYATEMTGLINGKKVTIVKRQEDLFGSHWGHGFFKTKFSDYTDDALNETADVTLGDAWLPEYTKDSLGNNILIVRDKIILDILEDGLRSKKIRLDKVKESDIIRSQPGLIHHTRDDLPYRLYKRDKKQEWRPRKRLKASRDITFLRKTIQNIREDIVIHSHIQYKKAAELDDWSYFERSMQKYLRRYKWVYILIQLRRNGPMWFAKKILKTG